MRPLRGVCCTPGSFDVKLQIMLRVNLFGLNQCAVIVLMGTGVVYVNQVGGTLCRQNEAEGILVPFASELDGASQELTLLTHLRKLLLEALSLTNEQADSVNALLAAGCPSLAITVDRSRLDENCEAWVHVDIHQGEFSSMQGFGECKGILTWPNSD
jgi:hypothetical protein